MPRFVPALLCVAILPTLAAAQEWPGWRGPRGDGTTVETDFPTRWTASDGITWKTALPGTGHSSPIVWGDRVFVTGCREAKRERLLVCLDRATGSILWEKVVLTAPLEGKHALNSYASSTPATDGKYVWVTFLDVAKIVVAAYDYSGTEVWRTTPGQFNSKHGFCSSPVLFEKLVIVNCDQDDQEAFIVAFDRATGKEVWRADRPNRTRSYCVPLLIDAGGPQLVLSGSKCVASYDPRTGKQLWLMDGPTEQFVASLVYADGVLCLTGGFPDYHLMGLSPTGRGNVTKSAVVWHERKHAAYVPAPVAADHTFFLVNDQGMATAQDTRTGQRHYAERLSKHTSASPVTAGGFLYTTDDAGITYVLKSGPKFEVVSKNPLGEACFSSPAFSRGHIFIRGDKHLFCVGPSKGVR